MIIDIHAHPVLLDVINEDPEDLSFRKQQFGVFKSGRNPIEFEKLLIDDARIDKVVWLPEDYSTQMGRPIVSNEEMEKIVASCPERFIGFASIDPRDPKAKEKLVYAFETQKLSGLKLNLSRLHMYADDPLLAPLYEVCEEHNKPIMFHAGYSWEPDTPSKYSEPIRFEDVAVNYPNLRFCLAHMGWPWWEETIMMLMKYPNVYADTSMVYMDSPRNYYSHLFSVNMNLNWLQNCFQDKVMFGSNNPRFRHVRSLDGILNLPLREDVKKAIEEVVLKYGRLDCAFNNAGIGPDGVRMPYESLTEISEKTWDLVVDVDMKGVFLCLKYELLQMQKQGFGTIVNTASIGGYKMAPGFAAYGPAKAAVIALTEMAALENAAFGIRVNAICPGPTMGTELTKNSLSTNPHEEAMLKEHVIPMKKLAMTQEVVNAVLWLSSDQASHTTGQKIFIDGGMHIA